MGLIRILGYSALTGISFAFAYRVIESGESGTYSILGTFLQITDSRIQALVMIASLILAIFSIFRMSKFLIQVYEHRREGVATAILGLCGSLLVFLSQGNFQVLLIGIGMWIIGIVFVVAHGKKTLASTNID